jgi:Ni2+-binding GTPase involved in maturation of urease and hydrogenase
MDVDVKKLEQDVRAINPKTKVVATNARTGEGTEKIAEALGL